MRSRGKDEIRKEEVLQQEGGRKEESRQRCESMLKALIRGKSSLDDEAQKSKVK
jgi:hypothetical protein